MDKYWEVKKDGAVVAYGPKSTAPDEVQRKRFREAGYKVYVEGKLFREGKCYGEK